jgi:vancomycin permeability regulator SanA
LHPKEAPMPESDPPGDPRLSGSTSGGTRRWWRRHPFLAAGAGVGLITVLVLAASNLWVRLSAMDHEFTVADAPSAAVALVLGAGLTPDGRPSPALQVRLDVAAALYSSGKAQVLLVSGDNGTTTHDEPTAMRNYLVQHGVPAGRVVLDYAGFDTWDSCVRAKKIFGVDRALVVTQQFHVARAVFLCREAGIDADGVADPHDAGYRLAFSLREIPAAVKACWDALVQPDPRFLGAPEHGVWTALGR